MKTVGYAAHEPHGLLKEFVYDLGPLGAHQVDVKVESCGLCHSDVSMLDNHWGMTTYPFCRVMRLSVLLKQLVPM